MLMHYICISELRVEYATNEAFYSPMHYICISELRVAVIIVSHGRMLMHYICISEELRYGTGQMSKNSVNMHCMYKCELSYL